MGTEEEIAELQVKFSSILKDFSYMCKLVTQKSDNLLSKMKKSDNKLDSQSFNKIGNEIASILENLNRNSVVTINSLLGDLDIINANRSEKICKEMHLKLSKCVSATVTNDSNCNISELTEKESLINNGCLGNECGYPTTSIAVKGDNINKENTSSSQGVTVHGLSLRKETTTDTIQTEDSWKDTLQRSQDMKSDPDLSDKEEEGSKNSVHQRETKMSVNKCETFTRSSSDDEIYNAETQKINQSRKQLKSFVKPYDSTSQDPSENKNKAIKTKLNEDLDKNSANQNNHISTRTTKKHGNTSESDTDSGICDKTKTVEIAHDKFKVITNENNKTLVVENNFDTKNMETTGENWSMKNNFNSPNNLTELTLSEVERFCEKTQDIAEFFDFNNLSADDLDASTENLSAGSNSNSPASVKRLSRPKNPDSQKVSADNLSADDLDASTEKLSATSNMNSPASVSRLSMPKNSDSEKLSADNLPADDLDASTENLSAGSSSNSPASVKRLSRPKNPDSQKVSADNLSADDLDASTEKLSATSNMNSSASVSRLSLPKNSDSEKLSADNLPADDLDASTENLSAGSSSNSPASVKRLSRPKNPDSQKVSADNLSADDLDASTEKLSATSNMNSPASVSRLSLPKNSDSEKLSADNLPADDLDASTENLSAGSNSNSPASVKRLSRPKNPDSQKVSADNLSADDLDASTEKLSATSNMNSPASVNRLSLPKNSDSEKLSADNLPADDSDASSDNLFAPTNFYSPSSVTRLKLPKNSDSTKVSKEATTLQSTEEMLDEYFNSPDPFDADSEPEDDVSVQSRKENCEGQDDKPSSTRETGDKIVNLQDKNEMCVTANEATEIIDVADILADDFQGLEENGSPPPNENKVPSENDAKEKEASEIEDYPDPYSVETQKLSTDDENESERQTACQKNTDLYSEHNYSCASASDLEDSPAKSKRLKLDQSRKSAVSGNESDINIEESLTSASEQEKIDDDSDTTTIKAGSKNDAIGSDSAEPDERDYIFNEHNYSSSSSPGIVCPEDSDGTDIEKVVESYDVQLNVDNFTLEVSRGGDEGTKVSSSGTKSYEFDVCEYPDELGHCKPGHKSKPHETERFKKSLVINICDNISQELDRVEKQKEETIKELVIRLPDCFSTKIAATHEKSDVSKDQKSNDSKGEQSNDSKDDKSNASKGEQSNDSKDEKCNDSKGEQSNDSDEKSNACKNKAVEDMPHKEVAASEENIDKDNVDTVTSDVEVTASDKNNDTIEEIMERELLRSDNENDEDIDDTLMDVTLEEILSDNEEHRNLHSSQDTIPYYDIKSEVGVIKIEKSEGGNFEGPEGSETSKKPANVPASEITMPPEERRPNSELADELLELLREVPASPIKHFPSPTRPVRTETEEAAEVERILQRLKEDESELSDSIDSDSVMGNLSDLSVSSSGDEVKIVDNDDVVISKTGIKEHNMLECYIRLERIDLPKNVMSKYTKALKDNIDWLCDLNNLSNKRKHAYSASFGKRHRKKGKRVSSSESSLSSSCSSPDSSDDNNEDRSGMHNLTLDQEQRLDEILAGAICNNLRDGSGHETDSDDSDDSEGEKKKKKSKIRNKSDNDKEKVPLTKEELEKKAWRNDPLLRGKLTSSDSDDEKRKNKHRKKGYRYEDDTEFSIHSEPLDSDSGVEGARAKNQCTLDENKISPIKRNIPVSDTSDSDSDVQYVTPTKPTKPTPDDCEEGPSPASQKGRRNIRSLVSDDYLAKDTQKANREELERIERLKDRHKIFETLSQSFNSQNSEKEEVVPLVLDVDEDTAEALVEVNPVITKKLKPHQRDGIKFMWDSCYESLKRLKQHPGSGCILAHCMGLGKTVQVLALVHTLFSYDEADTKHVLIVCPLSTVSNWKKELKFAFQGLPDEKKFSFFTFPNKKDIIHKYNVVKNWHLRKKAMLVVGYEGFEVVTNENKLDKNGDHNLKQMILEALVDPGPDLVVCDEGHLIKNKKAVRTMALNKIRTKRRIVLTGTPLQNNLIEYYHMVHFVKPNLLGTMKEFTTNFVNPITNGQYEDSTYSDIKFMRSRTHVLHKILMETVQRVEDTELELYLPKMLDHAIFVQLHQVQVDLYSMYSNTVRHNTDKVGKKFLGDLNTFQYLSTHPSLLTLMQNSSNKKVKEQDVICEDDELVYNMKNWWKDKMPPDAIDRVEYGHKMLVLLAIIEECEAVGDKLLVFSQKLAELDLIEHFLNTVGTRNCRSWKKKVDYFRMDGTVSPDDRSTICDTFNDESREKVRLLLMSTKVGGLGLNLTAANRVVIMTVHWNPSYDTQSVFRVYRFGQKKQVYVYRLISLDTMEEKVYQRSVTKLAIAHRVVDKHQITRHYKSIDLRELYSCQPSADNERPTPNVPEDEMLAKLILKLPCIFKYHEHKALLADRPEDKLTEQEMAAAWEDFKNKDKPKPAPPPPPQAPPNVANGPTFEQAFNLGRLNLNKAAASGTPPFSYAQQLQQLKNYYLPNHDPKAHLHVLGRPKQANNIPTPMTFDNQVPSTSKNIDTISNQVPSTDRNKNSLYNRRAIKVAPNKPTHKNQQNKNLIVPVPRTAANQNTLTKGQRPQLNAATVTKPTEITNRLTTPAQSEIANRLATPAQPEVLRKLGNGTFVHVIPNRPPKPQTSTIIRRNGTVNNAQHVSPTPEISIRPHFPLTNLVQNPFGKDKSSADKAKQPSPAVSSGVNPLEKQSVPRSTLKSAVPRPQVKRKFGATEMVLKKFKADGSPAQNSSNAPSRQTLLGTDGVGVHNSNRAAESIVESISLDDDVASRTKTISKDSVAISKDNNKTGKENNGVITLF